MANRSRDSALSLSLRPTRFSSGGSIFARNGSQLPDGATSASLGINAKVLLVDPSYRLLTVKYANGRSEMFKPGLEAKMLEMAPGDSVMIRPAEVTGIKIEK